MPEEVSNPFGISGASGVDPAMLAASAEAERLRGKDVVDVNGHHLGRVTRAFAEEGALVRFDVHLSHEARVLFGVEASRKIAGVPADAIATVEGEEVRLRQAAEQILRPERPAALDDRGRDRGAREGPRKNR